MPRITPLQRIRVLHTVVWVFFASCIIAVPLLAWAGRFASALLLMGVVSLEILVLALNGWSCPLTAVAARYTEERRDNFDIYLPLWLARHNKRIFGVLFAGGVAYTTGRWLGWLG